jgi:hypothetical protein
MSSESEETGANEYRSPSEQTLKNAWKISLVEDKEVKSDYWASSIDKTSLIGVRENQEKLLVKSEDEYTSPIGKIYRVEGEFIVLTENSVYIIDAGIPTKRIS